MRELNGKVAVVTGAASGIGRALAERFAREGMKAVLADVEAPALLATEAALAQAGATVLAVPTDVSKAEAVEALARRTIEAFGAVHVVCNNAGVTGPVGPLWEATVADWEWTLGVNLRGVIHGIRAFVPRLLAQGGEGHVVNTASIAGLIAHARAAPYVASKHAVVALSEVLAKDLLIARSAVKVSVLCPGFVRTRIIDSARNRPADLAPPASTDATAGQEMEPMRRAVEGGIAPEAVADAALDAIRDERFYVLTHPEFNEVVRLRFDDVLEGRYPCLPPRRSEP
jgi:NAD(P)-dependent dehydrogenase (short-subunit alcohol dehydrogenase family)